MSPRTQTTLAFLASGIAMLFITIFAVLNAMEPLLRGGPIESPPIQAALDALYPFAGANDIRALYGAVALLPILLPIVSGRRAAAWFVLALGAATTLVNLNDAVVTHLLAGEVVFGLVFVLSVGVPSAIGLAAAVRWIRAPG